MNAEFEKYWKSSRASDRPFAETNAQILDKMIAKTHFLAGAATGYANGVAVMREKCAEVAESTTFEVEIHELMEMTKKDMGDRACHEVAAAIRKIEVG